MPSLFAKLNLTTQSEIIVIDAPESFEPELAALQGVNIIREPRRATTVAFAIAFVTTLAEVKAATAALAPRAAGDPILWMAYPKGSSKKFACEFNRDTGWAALASAGFEPVRQVALDEDWSALRFRRVENIKSMTRSFAATEAGRKKVAAAAKAKPDAGGK